jgi:hypothetical protein
MKKPRHPGNRVAIIRGPCPWIPDIFPEIQEKFRDDGAFCLGKTGLPRPRKLGLAKTDDI